jgi:hypothetical protein
MLSKPFYDDSDISIVVFSWFRVDKYIIKIYNHEVVDKSREYFINISLEYYWSISEAKRHHQIFEITVFGLESGFLLITFSNTDLIIYILEIEFGKLDGSCKSVQCFINKG